MHSPPPLHIDVQQNDIPLMASTMAGKIIALLPNPACANVMALISERGLAVWNASDTATIEKDILTEHPEADPIIAGCWGDKGNSLFLVSGSRIIEFDCQSSQIELRFECPVNIVWMGWWSSHSILVVITEDKHISFFDFTQQKSLVHQLETKGYPSLADLNSTQNALVIVQNETATRQFITLMELESCQTFTRFESPLKYPASSISIAASGRRVAIGSEGGELITRMFNMREQPKKPDYYKEQSGGVGCLMQPHAHNGPVAALAWSSKKEYLLASAGANGSVILYNTSSRKSLGSQEVSTWPIMGVAFMADFIALSIGTTESSNNSEEGPFTLLKGVPAKLGK